MSTQLVPFFNVSTPVPIGLASLFIPLPQTPETGLLSISCNPADQVATQSSISGIASPPYYGWLISFNITKTVFTNSLYFIVYWSQSYYNPCLQLPFTNIYLVSGGTLYIFFSFVFGT